MRIVASVGDGHTSVRDALNGFRSYPFKLRWFEDGLYVVGAQEEAQRAPGSRLVKIGDTELERAFDRTSVYLAHENDWNKKANSETLLTKAELLYASGILPSLEQGDFTFVDKRDDAFTLTLKPGESWGGWESVQHETPLYLKRPLDNFWTEYLEDSRLLFIKYNICDGDGFKSLTERALKMIDDGLVDTLAIDLRGNGGGNSTLFSPLLKGLKSRTIGKEPGQLYGVTDRETYSSALMNALDLKTQTAAVMLGEPPSARPNSYGEVRAFTLPNSRLEVYYSTKFFRLVRGDPPAVMPDVPIEPTFADYAAGRDPVLGYVLEHAQTSSAHLKAESVH